MTTDWNYAEGVEPTELQDARRFRRGLWQALTAVGRPAAGEPGLGVSFEYGGRPVAPSWPRWRLTTRRSRGQNGVVRRTVTRTDPTTGLAVIVEFKEYPGFPVVEWGVRLRNTSRRRTPLIANVQSLDVSLNLGTFPYLNYSLGDYCLADGYEPFRVALGHEEEYRFAPLGGRPTNRAWPYYNLEWPGANRGVIVVVGWAGQWASCFRGLADQTVRITAGQELTHFRLLPGEEVRTPLSVLLFWRGDQVRAQNLWRRWMLAHNLPRLAGKLPAPMLPAYTGRWFAEMAEATESTQIAFLERYRAEGIQLDYWWMDAGWYPCPGGWWTTGTWEPDRQRFPRGLRAVCDHAHAKGIQTLVWFEPERVAPGTWLATEHPEWLLADTKSPPAGFKKGNRLLNLGHPQARQWLIDHVSDLLVREGIDVYRQDFNFDPLPFWRAHDAPDRQGITEIRHVEGYLAFWQALRRRFPGMLIDSCASGGRRNDLETMRLAVPLHKTDYQYDDLTTKQAMHHTLSSWFPYYGAYVLPVDTVDTYAFRSALAPMTLLTYDLRRRDVNWAKLKELTEEWRRVTGTGYFYGDYYPLTPYNRDDRQWIAWQFHRPDQDAGVIQAFRRKDSPVLVSFYPLRGLDPKATYAVTDLDRPGSPSEFTGESLLVAGLGVAIPRAGQAVVLVYRRKGGKR